jgi:hypothetical protein
MPSDKQTLYRAERLAKVTKPIVSKWIPVTFSIQPLYNSVSFKFEIGTTLRSKYFGAVVSISVEVVGNHGLHAAGIKFLAILPVLDQKSSPFSDPNKEHLQPNVFVASNV